MVSTLDATFTVSPNKQNRGMWIPTTPATQEPGNNKKWLINKDAEVYFYLTDAVLPLKKFQIRADQSSYGRRNESILTLATELNNVYACVRV